MGWKLVSAYKKETGMLVGVYLDKANHVRKGQTVDFWEKEVPLPQNGSQLQEYLGLGSAPRNYKMFSHRLILQNGRGTWYTFD